MILIKKITREDDIESICKNLYIDGLIAYHGELSDEFCKLYQSRREYLRQEAIDNMLSGNSYVAIDSENDKPIGILINNVINDNFAYLSDLWVEPEHRHQKVGTQLVNRFIEDWGDRAIGVLVLDENSSVMDFYNNFGFNYTSTEEPTHFNIKSHVMVRPPQHL